MTCILKLRALIYGSFWMFDQQTSSAVTNKRVERIQEKGMSREREKRWLSSLKLPNF